MTVRLSGPAPVRNSPRAMARVGPGLRDKAGARAAVQPCQDPAPAGDAAGRGGAPSVCRPGSPDSLVNVIENAPR